MDILFIIVGLWFCSLFVCYKINILLNSFFLIFVCLCFVNVGLFKFFRSLVICLWILRIFCLVVFVGWVVMMSFRDRVWSKLVIMSGVMLLFLSEIMVFFNEFGCIIEFFCCWYLCLWWIWWFCFVILIKWK